MTISVIILLLTTFYQRPRGGLSGMEFNSLDIDWEYLLERIERLLDLEEEYLTRKLIDYQPEPQLFQQHLAFWWRKSCHTGYLEEVTLPDLQDHANLLNMDDVIDRLCENTAQFVHGLPCNNILLRGEPGSGKQSAIKGLLKKFGDKGLRLIEIHTRDLHQLPLITSCLRGLPYYFVLFSGDLFHSMEATNCRELADLLQGGIETRATNILFYATSNHTSNSLADPDNSGSISSDHAKLFPDEQSAERGFGIIIDLPPTQRTSYLDICRLLVQQRALPITDEAWQPSALAWAEQLGRYSGLTALQFIDDLTGKMLLRQKLTNKP